MTSISIIIATASRPASLTETLRSLAEVRIPEIGPVELVMVESGARTGVEVLARDWMQARCFNVKCLFEPGRGKSRALNRALTEAGGEILLFSDDDVRFPANWIEHMCEPIVSGNADAVAGGVRLAPHLLKPWMNKTHRAWLASTSDYLSFEAPSEMCGANMAISRRVFERIGGFDPELGPGITNGGEESLLTWQLLQAGFRLASALDVEVEHHPDPARLCYKNWVEVARLRGVTRAYHLCHWLHQPLPHARALKLWVGAKLLLRRCLARERRPEDEGIAPWELSYLEDISTYASYLHEREKSHARLNGNLPKLAARNPIATP
jgi:GT2 family glycosyltransferase